MDKPVPIHRRRLGIISIPRPVKYGTYFISPDDRKPEISGGGSGQIDYRKSDPDAWSRKIGF